jgi:protocatechuate 3,4-dioxygenase beta subunit
MPNRKFTIYGQVSDQCGNAAAGLRVEAWDKDWRGQWQKSWGAYDDFVGAYTTGPDGAFQIEFDEAHYLQLPEDQWPDIYFKIIRAGAEIANTEKDVLCNIPAGKTRVEIKVDIPGAKGAITGAIVYDTKGGLIGPGGARGIKNVQVRLEPAGANPHPAPPQQMSDDKGRFTFSDVCPGEWLVTLETELEPEPWPAGRPRLRLAEPTLAHIFVKLGAVGPIDLGEIRYVASGGFVEGTIFVDEDEDGILKDSSPRPINVDVFLVNLDTHEERPARTDAHGRYHFDDPPPGKYRLEFKPTLDAAKHGLDEGMLGLPDRLPPAFFLGADEERIINVGYVAMKGAVRGVVFLDKDATGQRYGAEPGIPGVRVLLVHKETKRNREGITDASGEYAIDAPPGDYSLRFRKAHSHDLGGLSDSLARAVRDFESRYGDDFELTTDPTQPVRIRAGETTQARPTGYQAEEHVIAWEVTTSDGQPAQGVLVQVWDQNRERLIAEDRTGADGRVRIRLDQAGAYSVLVYSDEEVPMEPQKRVVSVHSEATGRSIIPSRAAPIMDGRGRRGGGGDGDRGISDLTAFPLLTEEIGAPGEGGAGLAGPGAPGAAPLGQIVESAFREVLSWRPKANDTKGFLSALAQSFEIKQVQGHTEFKWTPRTYAVQLDMGAVTGAQASIYTRARASLIDQSLPLLAGLAPLLPDADREDVEANRAIVESLIQELVSELGMEGGPRVQRVDAIFEALLGENPSADPELVDGQLGLLRDEFGLARDGVNTVQEEHNLTNFFILVDHVYSLKLSWDAQRKFFDRVGPEVFLGTQLVLVSRTLAVVAESVQETYFAMNSVFLGQAERQTTRLEFAGLAVDVPTNGATAPYTFPVDAPSMFVAELLAWTEYVASEEGPRLIGDGGKAGVIALFPIVDKLRKLVRAAIVPPQDPTPLPGGYRTARVQRALRELADHLDETASLLKEFVPSGNGNGAGA